MGALYCMVAGWLEGSIGFDGEEGRRRAEEAEDGVWMRRERKTIVPVLLCRIVTRKKYKYGLHTFLRKILHKIVIPQTM